MVRPTTDINVPVEYIFKALEKVRRPSPHPSAVFRGGLRKGRQWTIEMAIWEFIAGAIHFDFRHLADVSE
jgi:hypothetical protein